ncbi:MAG: serine hydrolase [Parcubacteria group bacterium]
MYEYRKGTEGISKTLLAFNGALFLSVLFMIFVISQEVKGPQTKEVAVHEELPPQKVFAPVSLKAKSAYVYDVAQNKILFKKNELAQLPLASITKLMMALTASELLPKDSKITIRKEFLEEEGNSGLLANESWKLKDLLDFSLIVSSNDGARSIASVIGATKLQTDNYDLGRREFISKMNDKARELGLKQMYFTNENGLDVGTTSGGYGSAVDVSNLLQYIMKNNPDILEATRYENLKINSQTQTHSAKNTNTDLTNIPGIIASKTGFTEMAGGNLVVAFDSSLGRPIIVVVLGSTQEGRFEDVEKLVKASLDYVVGE